MLTYDSYNYHTKIQLDALSSFAFYNYIQRDCTDYYFIDRRTVNAVNLVTYVSSLFSVVSVLELSIFLIHFHCPFIYELLRIFIYN